MPEFNAGNTDIELDDRGYLVHPHQWNEEVARALAAADGIDQLTADHWTLINFLRQYQLDHGTAPMIRVLCRETGFTLKRIYELFEKGPAKGACRVAGLPRPDSCV